MVAKRAYIWFGYINGGRELREREVLSSTKLFFFFYQSTYEILYSVLDIL